MNDPNVMSGLARTLNQLAWLVLLALGLTSFFALPWSMGLPAAGIVSCGAALLGLVFWMAAMKPRLGDGPQAHAGLLLCITACGLLLRIVYVLVVPPEQLSDMA